MKRRVLSLTITLALCLNLCPVWVLAADEETDSGPCPHHAVHTEACGYVSPASEQECTHQHDDGCYTKETNCIHEHTAECCEILADASEPGEPVLCTHICTEDGGCITQTLSCPHTHDGACGYVPGNPGVPCGFVCQICPIEGLIGGLPSSISEDNREQVQDRLSEIYALYDELTGDQQQQVDLSPCVSLWDQIDELGAAVQSDTGFASSQTDTLESDQTISAPHVIAKSMTIDTNGHTVTATNTSVIQITGSGGLYLTGGGRIVSKNGAGVEVMSGGLLSIDETGVDISGTTYALDIASDAEVQLSGGTYFGKKAAIRADDFAALLAPGYVYFDAAGNAILPADMAAARTVVVGQCMDHSDKSYGHDAGTVTHTWTCSACGKTESERCKFEFQQDGTGACVCGNGLAVVVDERDLTDMVYDGEIKPEEVGITVTLTDGSNKELVKGTDYKVDYDPRKDAGEVTVTVTGLTFEGTFTRIYLVDQDQPVLEWDTVSKPVPVEVDYDGEPVEAGDLPPVEINIKAPEDLHEFLQYSHKKPGGADYTDGLPTDAGTYDVIVSLPEMQNFEAAVSAPITLTINKISPIVTAPEAAEPVYNGAVQNLVTAGTLDPAAVNDGLEIKFAENANGPFVTDIPTGTDAGDYRVWYTVEVTDNYLAIDPDPTEIPGVKILCKQIKPDVTLSETSYLYDGGYKRPAVTVKDVDHKTILLDTEYEVEYVNNRDVSTEDNPAKVVVTDKAGGNYDIGRVEVPFEITLRTQEALSITNQPSTVIYGGQFTLGTSGGSGDGLVTWEVIEVDGVTVAEVGQNSGQVTIVGVGKATVKATKSGTDPATGVTNYEDATATWTLDAGKKSVTAIVRVEDKDYDGKTDATVTATLQSSDLVGSDNIKIKLSGSFEDPDAGANKKVTIDSTSPDFTGSTGNYQNYHITYPATATATIRKAIAKITTEPVGASLTYNGTERDLIATGAVADPASVPVEYALSEDGPYSTDLPKGVNAGEYTVWYRIQETGNYTGEAPKSVTATIAKKSVNPTITLDQDTFVYDGTAKEPVVTLIEADGTTEIPADEYTVEYSGNVDVGTAAVTVTAKDDGNYSFAAVKKNFTIGQKQATVLTHPKPAGKPLVFDNMALELVTEGTGSGGTMVYRVGPDGDFEPAIPTETNAGTYMVYYKVQGDTNHSDSEEGQVEVTISPKTVKDPTIELFDGDDPLNSYTYDGNAKEPRPVVKDGSTVISADEYNIVYSDNIDAGTAVVNITDKPGGNYTVTGSATFVIKKANIVFDRDPAAAVIIYDGKPHELLVPGETSGGEVQYALDSPTSAYGPAIPTGVEARKYTVYYKVVGDENHNHFAVQSVDVTIQRKPLTDIIIELTPDSFEYDGNPKMPTVTVKFKEGKVETVVPDTEYDWTCSDTAPTNKGAYTITIEDLTGGNYDLTNANPKTADFTIGETAQAELVIEDKPDSTVYGDTFTLRTSGGSSSSAVTWEVKGPATVDAATGEVEITGIGEVTVTATNPGDQNYLPVFARWTFTAAPKPVTASVVVGNKVYDGTTAAAVTSAGITTINGDTVTIDKASITAAFETPGVGTGKTVTLDTSKVQVTGADAAKYEISYPGTANADITQATTQITTNPKEITSLTYNGQPQELVTAGETNVGFLVYSLDGTDFSSDIPTGTNAGTYTVYYKVEGTADYTGVAVNTTPISVTIAPKPITPVVELSETSFLYDGSRKEPKITVKDDKTAIDPDQYSVTWANDDTSVTDGVLTAAGTYTATITSVTNGNYSFTATAQVEIKAATQQALNITGKPEHVYYGDTVTTLEAAGGTGNGTVKWSIAAGGTNASIDEDWGVLTANGIGPVTVKAERTVPNYKPATDIWTFTVEPRPVVAEVTITPKDYDGTTAAAVASASITALNGDTVTIAPASITAVFDTPAAGTGKTVRLDASKAQVTGADAAKYTISYPANAQGDINPRQVTVTVTLSGNDLKTKADGTYYYEYDGEEKTPTVTVTADDNGKLLAASDYSVTITGNKNVGEAIVTVSEKTDGNYTFADEEVCFRIEEVSASLTLPPRANDLTYIGETREQELVTGGTAAGGHIEYALDGGSYSKEIPKAEDAGTYTVTYKVVGDSNHADGQEGSVTVTIKPKQVISPKVTVSGSYTYDGSAKEPAAADIEVKDGTTTIPADQYEVTCRDNINAGTATVIISSVNGGNYIVNGMGTFEITKGTASVATGPTGLTNLPYNGTEQALVQAGAASGGTMVYSLSEDGPYTPSIPTGKAVKGYTVWYKAQGDSNHNDSTPASVTASIVKNTVTDFTIRVTPESVTYNGKRQEPTVTVQDDNGVIDGSEYTVTYQDEAGNSVDGPTNVGTYTLTITGVAGGNYTFDDTDGKNTAEFEILPAGQTPLTITGTRERVYYGDTIQLGTTGGNGTVTWQVDNGPASIDKDTGLLTITGVGSVTVTATSKAVGYENKTATWPFRADEKPVTAVVTVDSKTYDSNTDATVTAKLQSSDLVGSDDIEIKLSGSFEDPNAGANKKVTVDSTSPDFTGSTGSYQNYRITYPATATASIFKADVTDVTRPTAVNNLEYTGLPLTLVAAGSSTEGSLEYSLDDRTYSASLPTGIDAGDYEVWYRVKGDGNHNDTTGTKLGTVTIAQQEVLNPTIEFNPDSASYDGTVHKPKVIVKDKNNRVIPDSEYSVDYGTTDWKTAGDHEVTVTDNTDGNYQITTKTGKFTISAMGQSSLSIVDKPGRVQYGDTFTLSALGGSGTGAIKWESSNPDVATINQNGFVEIKKSGAATITATKLADGNYGEVSATWSFSAEKKRVTLGVTASDKEYNGSDKADLDFTWQPGLLGDDEITLNLTGKFSDANAGTNKTVTIIGTVPTDDRYDIKPPAFPTASITPKPASVSGSTPTELTYNGGDQNLVTGVTAVDGTLAYSKDGSYYTLIPPKEAAAGTYPVWYKAQASGNYKDSPAVRVDVTIKPKVKALSIDEIELSSNSFDYDGTPKRPDVVVKDGSVVIPPSEYTVSYSNNTGVGTATVTITDNSGGNYEVSGSKTFTIKAGAPAVTEAPEPRSLTYDGREKTLVTRGTAVNGHMEYSSDEYDYYSTALPKGTDAGTYEVWYKAVGTDGTETIPKSVIAEILPNTRPATVTVNPTSDPLPYTGSPQKPPVTVVVDGTTLTKDVDYTVTYSNNTNVGTATVTVQGIRNYQFTGTATFEIAKSKATFSEEPKAREGLFYTGKPQPLVTTGRTQDGLVLYSTDGYSYSVKVPTGTERGDYMVIAKVQGDDTHEDSKLVVISSIVIGRNEVNNPTVTLSQTSFDYTGGEHRPTVTVADDRSNVIADSEYTVSYSNNINVGEATVTVTSKGNNYSFEAKPVNFRIDGVGQTTLTITGQPDTAYYGDTFSLEAAGGSGTGAVKWSSSDESIASVDQNTGVVTINKKGSVTITARKAASAGYGEAAAELTFYAYPKPINAIVTAASKPYDGGLNAPLTVTFNRSDLIGNDNLTATATGNFADANVGENKSVTIDSVTISDDDSQKYDVKWPAITTASIIPAAAKVMEAPKPAESLTYNGSFQTLLLDGGTATGGNITYSVNGGASYSFELPTGKEAKDYTIWYKVVASNKNYEDSAPVKMDPVTISVNKDEPKVMCTPGSVQYSGKEQTPTVVVRDNAQLVIPENEYTVTFEPTPMIAVGTYKVIVTDKPGSGNYEFTDPVEGTFEIAASSQPPLSIVTDKATDVYYGDSIRLTALGGSGSGDIRWSIDKTGIAEITSASGNNCVVTVKGTEGFTVSAYREGKDGYSNSNTDSVPFVAHPKPVTPVVTAQEKNYDGSTGAVLAAACKSGDLVTGDTITFTVTGKFVTADVGTDKQVEVLTHDATGTNADKYAFDWPKSTKASIYKVNAQLDLPPERADNLVYDGQPQTLLASGGRTVKGIGTIVYSLRQDGEYSSKIPEATEVGKYTVWYKVADNVNYTGIPAASIEVEIKAADSGTTGGGDTGTSTPPSSGTDSTQSASADGQTTVRNGTASTVVSAADGSKLVKEAAANQSQSIVIKPEITGDVTKTQVSIPVSTVSQIRRETNAALTVSSPIADVTIPHAALDTLGQGSGTVNVVTEQTEQGVVLTLTAGGENVESVPGGLTLTVPAADAAPGTVAVLVRDDGTRETLRKSVVENGRLSIPLSGSATVEIVDNSKEFADVPSTNWAADAVAFASAHELFSGTSETTFSPDQSMSRGMLATVLYNLEGQPDQTLTMQDLTGGYNDVSGDAWYADGIAWAVENGIANGYGNGQFGPNDSITREQFVVMLWKYAGSPEAGDQVLTFTDADQASGYALEALRWAVEKGILSGYSNGQLTPGGTATRAQAAQMLKNFMENA